MSETMDMALKMDSHYCKLIAERDDLNIRLALLEREYVDMHGVKRERDALKAELKISEEGRIHLLEAVDLMKAKLSFCTDYRKYEAEISRLRGELDLIKRNMKKTWPECELMDEVIKDRDHWQALAMKAKEALLTVEEMLTPMGEGAECDGCGGGENDDGTFTHMPDCDFQFIKDCLAAYSEKGE